MANGDQSGWWVLPDTEGNILKKYPNPDAGGEKNKSALVRIYDWPVDGQGQPLPKNMCKLTKGKKTVKIENKDHTFDGEVKAK